MNYAELRQAIIEDTHRADLADLVPRFIRQAEGLIRRDLTAFILRGQLTDADRAGTSALYNLPPRTRELRKVTTGVPDAGGFLKRKSITAVAPSSLPGYPISDTVKVYAVAGDNSIEFRGNPPAGTVFDITYYGTPAALANDDDTNDLLTLHETLYIAGAAFFVYRHTQDRELAADELDVFNGVISTLNEQFAREIGGASVEQGYRFSRGSSY